MNSPVIEAPIINNEETDYIPETVRFTTNLANTLQELLSKTSDVNLSLVSQIKHQIASNNYSISEEKIAEGLLSL